MTEANHFQSILTTLENDINSFSDQNARAPRSVEDLSLAFISLESRLQISEAHFIYLQKFSHYLTDESRDALVKTQNSLLSLKKILSEEKQKIESITLTLGKNISSSFTEIEQKTLELQTHVLDWNRSRLLSDAATSAITATIAKLDFNKFSIPNNDDSSPEKINSAQEEMGVINSLIQQFKLLMRRIILPDTIEHTVGIEPTLVQKKHTDQILNPLETVIQNLKKTHGNTNEMIALSIALQELKNKLSLMIQSERKKGVSYFDIENGNIGRVVKNVASAFDDLTCAQISNDLNNEKKSPEIKEKLNVFITQLRAQENPIRQETLCCSFALDCALSNNTSNDTEQFRKTHLRLKKIKTNTQDTVLKSEAYLLMRDCVRDNSKENQATFAAFIKRPEVKKSTVGKTIAIGMLGFLGVIGIAALVVATHGLALPLIPIVVAKGLAAGSITASVLGLGGLAGEKKLEKKKTKHIKKEFFSFFSDSKEPAKKEDVKETIVSGPHKK